MEPLPASPVVLQKTHEFTQRLFVDTALKFDHGVQRHPVLVPAPGIEFWLAGRAQADVIIAADKAQQEPYLLLPPI